jgi:hypothetical protein
MIDYTSTKRTKAFLALFLANLIGWQTAQAGIEPIQPNFITAVCVADVNVSLGPTGNITLPAEVIDAGSADSGGPITSMTLSPNFFDCDDVGQTFLVTLTVSGPSGTNNCWSMVTVEDKLPPVAVCESDVFINLPPFGGSVTLGTEFVNAGSFDNCVSGLSFALSQSEFGCADVGSSVIVMTVTDAGGNTNSCFSTIHVEDNFAPTAVCESDVFITLPASGTVTLDGVIIGSGSTDNCAGFLTYTLSQDVFDCTDLGPNLVELFVIDPGGNGNSCFTTVHVSDNLPPSAVCVSSINVNIAPSGATTIFPVDIDAGSFDNCGFSLSFGSGQTTYTCSDANQSFIVELKVTDPGGLDNTCLTEVFVNNGGTPDDDCDGVSNTCDVCPGGDDSVDNNSDGLPDCRYPPALSQIIPAWKCTGSKVYTCKGGKTKCINYSALASQIENGAFLGPCGNASCGSLKQSELVERDNSVYDEILPVMELSANGTQIMVGLTDITTDGQLMVMDQLGRIVQVQNVSPETRNANFVIEARVAGMYVVTLRSNGQIVSERVILGL